MQHCSFGNYDEALDRNARALALGRDDAIVWTTRGNILDALERADEALAAYRAAMAVTPMDDHRTRAIVLNNQGSCLSVRGQYSEVDRALSEATEEYAPAADAWYNRALNQRYWAVAEYQRGNLAEARAHIELATNYTNRAVALGVLEAPRLLAGLERFALIQLG